MSMFSRFDKDLKHANGCLHEAADMFFHPIPEDIFHKWDHNHPPFPGPKLTKVRVECKGEEKKEEKKEEVKVTVKVDEKKDCSCGGGCSGGGCHCCCHHHHHCHCTPAPPPPPPPPAPPKNIRVYPCFEVIEAYDICESEWHPTMKDYTAEKIWQLHVYLPGVAKDKVIVDILDKTLVVHGQGVFHTHCGMWPEHIEHCCDCTRKEPTCFCKKFALPDNCKVHESRVEFEKEVMVIRIQRG
ncbi:hypothetical protein LPJ78_000919 [Coemansia sp. RSA 989]|nr:hypothetical protein BX667DRAFT_336822 [Coemansia mojavensis]KAJ1743685.1 hypothetical protein LPJ68_000742 [Coemansia sp. RSA 1086]KAJ1752886.1 hypothetical protein LPJ79_000873 [Coemansia sp. RSA 1821]KAJ1867509.1 hypothetical protein LPJ78_000919 [Coemansia sp. RSA 989]KAJ2650993.1 hypothetical protein IWW40_002012 [Coemansia sp. RSA 1250]KAJ2673519.1 hypothetical protein IWW42_002242 [Coemansia sp. RSA 1085]